MAKEASVGIGSPMDTQLRAITVVPSFNSSEVQLETKTGGNFKSRTVIVSPYTLVYPEIEGGSLVAKKQEVPQQEIVIRRTLTQRGALRRAARIIGAESIGQTRKVVSAPLECVEPQGWIKHPIRTLTGQRVEMEYVDSVTRKLSLIDAEGHATDTKTVLGQGGSQRGELGLLVTEKMEPGSDGKAQFKGTSKKSALAERKIVLV